MFRSETELAHFDELYVRVAQQLRLRLHVSQLFWSRCRVRELHLHSRLALLDYRLACHRCSSNASRSAAINIFACARAGSRARVLLRLEFFVLCRQLRVLLVASSASILKADSRSLSHALSRSHCLLGFLLGFLLRVITMMKSLAGRQPSQCDKSGELVEVKVCWLKAGSVGPQVDGATRGQ